MVKNRDMQITSFFARRVRVMKFGDLIRYIHAWYLNLLWHLLWALTWTMVDTR